MEVSDIILRQRSIVGHPYRARVIQSAVEDDHNFKKLKKSYSIKSMALELSGHSPIRKFVFSMDTLEMWCQEHNFKVTFDPEEKVYFFRSIVKV